MPTFIAKGAGKAVGEDTAREILAKFMFHIGGHGVAQGVLPARLKEMGPLCSPAPPDSARFARGACTDKSPGSGLPPVGKGHKR
jgi:hypothetical protein